MIDIEALWQSVYSKTPNIKEQGMNELRTHLETTDCPHAELLSGRSPVSGLDAASAQRLELSILEAVQQGKATRTVATQWFRWVRTAIKLAPAFLHEPGVAQVIHPTKIALAPRPTPSPFSPSNTALAGPVTAWVDSLSAWLEGLNDRDIAPEEWTAGMVLSAVLLGGLLDLKKVKSLLKQLTGDLPTIGLRPYAEFHQKVGKHGDFHCQRWFPDPVSELLYFRRPAAHTPLTKPQLEKAIQSLLRTHTNASALMPTNLAMLIAHARAWWHQRAASVDIAVIDRQIVAFALQDRSWNRLFGLMSKDEALDDPVEDAPQTEVDLDFDANFEMLHPWFTVLMESLDHPPKTPPGSINIPGVFEALGCPLSTLPDVPVLFIDWITDLLKGQNCTYDRLAVSTIKRYGQAILPALLSRLQGLNPVDLKLLDFVELYESIVDSATGSQRVNLAKGLREFHHYLARKHKIPSLKSIRETLGEDAGLSPVDANPISIDEYLRAREYLSQQGRRGGNRELLQIARLIMMLAFRTGMRRCEAMGLRLKDLNDVVGLDIKIRPHEERSLKSDAARRIIPARYLLPLEERRELQAWLRRRLKDADPNDENAWVFDVPIEDGWRRLSQEVTADRIIEALNHATGQSTTIHQLRHGFATWLYLALRAPDYPEALDLFEHLPHTRAFLERGKRFRQLLLKRTGATSREYAYVIGRLLGHSTPMVSLNCYIHSSEFIHRALAIRSASNLSAASLRGVANLKPVWGNRLMERGIESLMDHMRRQRIPSASVGVGEFNGAEGRQTTSEPIITTQRPSGKGKKGCPKKLAPTDWTGLMTVHELIHEYSSTSQSLGEICAQLDLRPNKAAELLKQADLYGKMFKFEERGTRPVAYPAFARTQAAKDSLLALEQKLKRALTLDSELVLSGIQTHLQHYNPNKRDVVFKGEKQKNDLARYVIMLNRMEFQPKDMQIILRKGQSNDIPSWATKPLGKFANSVVICNAPPVKAKAPCYANWVGIRPTCGGGTAWPGTVRGMMFLALLERQASIQVGGM